MSDFVLLERVNREAQKTILARVIAETYHGLPCEDEYVFGAATGGAVFVRCAEAVLSKLEELAE